MSPLRSLPKPRNRSVPVARQRPQHTYFFLPPPNGRFRALSARQPHTLLDWTKDLTGKNIVVLLQQLHPIFCQRRAAAILFHSSRWKNHAFKGEVNKIQSKKSQVIGQETKMKKLLFALAHSEKNLLQMGSLLLSMFIFCLLKCRSACIEETES